MRSLWSKTPLLLLILYVGVLLYGTLAPFRFTWHPGREKMNPRSRIEWVPFTHICPTHGILCPHDTGLNIAIFVPVGSLAALIGTGAVSRMRRVARATMLGFCLSLLIETIQHFIPARFPGTTDLILNTLGAFLGGLLVGGVVGLVARRREAVGVPRTRPA